MRMGMAGKELRIESTVEETSFSKVSNCRIIIVTRRASRRWSFVGSSDVAILVIPGFTTTPVWCTVKNHHILCQTIMLPTRARTNKVLTNFTRIVIARPRLSSHPKKIVLRLISYFCFIILGGSTPVTKPRLARATIFLHSSPLSLCIAVMRVIAENFDVDQACAMFRDGKLFRLAEIIYCNDYAKLWL